jgi:hypothetical protein
MAIRRFLQVLKRKPYKGNFENRTFDASVIFEAVAISLNQAGHNGIALISTDTTGRKGFTIGSWRNLDGVL